VSISNVVYAWMIYYKAALSIDLHKILSVLDSHKITKNAKLVRVYTG